MILYFATEPLSEYKAIGMLIFKRIIVSKSFPFQSMDSHGVSALKLMGMYGEA